MYENPMFIEEFPGYDVDIEGNVYKDGRILKPFRSNKYLQVVMYNKNGIKHTYGVHTVVAMKFIQNYCKGCVVHHIDENSHNNNLANLQVMSKSEHSRLHNIGNNRLAEYIQTFGPANKNKKMSKEFCKKCSDSAKLRVQRDETRFQGNQYVDKFGNKRI